MSNLTMMMMAVAGNMPAVDPQGPVAPTGVTFIQPCWSTYQINVSGEEFENSAATANNFSTLIGNWLTSGSASDVWVEQTPIAAFNFANEGTGRVRIDQTREYVMQAVGIGTVRSASCTFDFYDSPSGGNLIGSYTKTFTCQVTGP